MRLNAEQSLADNLKALNKKRVSVHLRGGSVLAGVVGDVGEHFVRIEELDQKEFFDALVRLSDITALEARARSS